MQVRRLFVDHNPTPSEVVRIDGNEHHYATRVLRLKKGQTVELITPNGCMDAVLESISTDTAHVRPLSSPVIKKEPVISISLFQGIPDHLEKLELIVQKSVELGVNRIIPFTSRYTDAKYSKMKLRQKMERMRKISREAVRQCGRSRIPEITDPVPLQKLEKELANSDATFLFFEKPLEKTAPSVENPDKIAIIIGPEGGFSDEEASWLTTHGCHSVFLPGRILRTETAAIACLTLVQARFGDFQHVL